MKWAVATFRSKTEVFEFIDLMEQEGVFVSTVGTPKEARIGCGISAKFSSVYIGKAQKIIRNGFFSGFYAIFLYSSEGGKTTSARIT